MSLLNRRLREHFDLSIDDLLSPTVEPEDATLLIIYALHVPAARQH